MKRKLKPKYCTICGKERDQIQSGYDEDTGQPRYRYQDCHIKDCNHGYHKFEFKHLFSEVQECKICGYIMRGR